MTDIVERLRREASVYELDDGSIDDLFNEAADEIERLRTHCPCCGHEWMRHDPEDGMCDAVDNLGVCACGRGTGAFNRKKHAEFSRRALEVSDD